MQYFRPEHVPYSFVLLHDTPRPSLLSLHSHELSSGRHCINVASPRSTDSHVYPFGQASTLQSCPQIIPSIDSKHKSPVALQCPSTAHVVQRRDVVFFTHTRPELDSTPLPVHALHSSFSGSGQSSCALHGFVQTPPLSGPSGKHKPSMHSRCAIHVSPYLRSAIIHSVLSSSTQVPLWHT